MNSETTTNEPSHSKTFVAVFLGLCFLTVISVVIANIDVFANVYQKWTAFLVVAFAKAGLVVGYFMHLRWEKYWKYFLTIPALLLGIVLVAGIYPDIGLRTQAYSDYRSKRGPALERPAIDVGSTDKIDSSIPDKRTDKK